MKTSLTIPEAKYLKDLGVHVFGVGVGLDDNFEINALVTAPSSCNAFLVDEYENLTYVQDTIVSYICKGMFTLYRL